MSGRREQKVIALPLWIKFSERDGYRLVCKISEGPNALLDRRISIALTAEQLNKINEWEVTNDCMVLDLERKDS